MLVLSTIALRCLAEHSTLLHISKKLLHYMTCRICICGAKVLMKQAKHELLFVITLN